MNDHEQEELEAELRQMTAAKPPQVLMVRLKSAKQLARARPAEVSRRDTPTSGLLWLLRWLIPATAVAIAAAALWRGDLPSGSRQINPVTTLGDNAVADATALRADDVQIDQELVSSFDAVARLPGGEPVRFRFQQWMDEVVVSDTAQGLIVESRTPRFEVVPVRFETY